MGHIAIVNFVSGSKGQSRSGMKAVIRYAAQAKKTLWQGQQLVSGVNCQAVSVYDDFLRTQLLHHKDSGRRFYHLVQSFPSGEEVDPTKAHLAARRLAEFFEDREVLVCTHTDRDHIHSHLIINAVALESGLKLHSDKALIHKLMRFNDQVCEEFQLPVFQPEQKKAETKAVSNAEYHSAAKGESWKFRLMNVIDNCMRFAASKDDFLELMQSEGYEIRWQDSRKYITYTTPEGRSCRDNRLHETKYSKEMMELEFRIRREIIFGRAASEKFAATGTADSTAPNPTGCDPMCFTGSDRTAEPVTGNAGMAYEETNRAVAGDQKQCSQPSTGGEDRGIFKTGREPVVTGWEGERETFLAFQNQTAEFSRHQFPSSDDSHSPAVADIVCGVVQFGQAAERIQSDTPIRDSTVFQAHTDYKAMKKQKEKKIALGHAEDEKAETFEFQMSM